MLRHDELVDLEADVLVVGSGGAGLRAAIAAADRGADVLLATKGKVGGSGGTITAGADISADSASLLRMGLQGDAADSPELYYRDTLAAGKGINDPALVQLMVEEVPARLEEMIRWGMGVTAVTHVAGHEYPRGAVTSGEDMVRTLMRRLNSYSIDKMEHAIVLDVIVQDERVCGALAFDCAAGDFVLVRCPAVILATGGGMAIYPQQTSAEELFGDGYAMALRAGARLVDMEMVQFMPCCLFSPRGWEGHQFPFVIGPGTMDRLNAHLLNRQGDRFMVDHDPKNLERSTRDVLTRAIAREVEEGRGGPEGGVYFSLRHLPRNLIADFSRWAVKPNLKPDWQYQGLDFSAVIERLMDGEALEVGNAAHFFCGGVQVDADCRTAVAGLFSAGEVIGGTHGANRLSGNACSEILVTGEVAGDRAARDAAAGPAPEPGVSSVRECMERYAGLFTTAGDARPEEVLAGLRQVAGGQLEVLRGRESLEEARAEIDRRQGEKMCLDDDRRVYNLQWLNAVQVSCGLEVAGTIARCALRRTESRGVHNRREAAGEDPEQLGSYRVRLDSSRKWSVDYVPVSEGNEP